MPIVVLDVQRKVLAHADRRRSAVSGEERGVNCYLGSDEHDVACFDTSKDAGSRDPYWNMEYPNPWSRETQERCRALQVKTEVSSERKL